MFNIQRPYTDFRFFEHNVWLNNLGQHFFWPVYEQSYRGCVRSRPTNGTRKNVEQRNLSALILVALY